MNLCQCQRLTVLICRSRAALQGQVSQVRMAVDISGMRKPYKGETDTFDVDNLKAKEPFGQFQGWFEEACETEGIMEANAMALATATRDGKPSVRMVLMKGYDKSGFKFFTNYESRKAQELEETGYASVVFYWTNVSSAKATWSRQVRVEGKVEKLSVEESTEYFRSRPKSSQIGACITNQSRPVESRKVLEDRNSELQKKYSEKDVPKPDNWGGYLLRPDTFEFWQGQTNRIHDRILFRRPREDDDATITKKGDEGWVYERLQP